MANEHAKSKEDLLKEFNSSPEGLSNSEAKIRLEKYGENTIKKTKKFRLVKIFLSQFNSFLIYILLIAAIISFLIGHTFDGIVIMGIVILNSILGFVQQYKAENALDSLKSFLIPKSKIFREGVLTEINSTEIVPGDIIVLNAGDKVNADARILDSDNLQTNEAALTGESLPVEKDNSNISENTFLAERKNMLFTGTQVVRGSCKALVVATSMNTEFGKIAQDIQDLKDETTPIQKRLDRFSKQIGVIIIVLAAIISLVGYLRGFEFVEIFLTAIALAVSAIPEGLPAVLTIGFAISSVAMSKNNVIIRKLPAVEALGSVTVICSDKTGTMTQEKMEVETILVNNKTYVKKGRELLYKNKKIDYLKNSNIKKLIETSILCNNSRFEKIKDKYEIIGDPTEQALVANSLDLGFDKKRLSKEQPTITKLEFDSKRKMMSVIRNNGRRNVMYSKGAIESILKASSSELVNGQIKKLSPKRKKEILEQSRFMEQKALRVLGFAYRSITKKDDVSESNLIFIGLVGMIDPPRPEIRDALRSCRDAGIKVKMITGDSEITARAIGELIGIKGKSITENQLKKMSDSELENVIDDISIFARTSPHEKLRIAEILKKKGEVVAMTGDGVNDALALKSADIGIAMGVRGTDVSREVSDIVLMDDNFASIVKGVQEGRNTYNNIKKFTKYLLGVNFSTLLLILTTIILNLPLPLLPLQILWMNLITDSFPALTLIFEKENLMKEKPKKEKNILHGIWSQMIFAGLIAFAAELTLYLILTYQGLPIETIRTMLLTTAVLFELILIYSMRLDTNVKLKNIFSNKWLNYSIMFSLSVQAILLYTALGNLFGVVPLSFSQILFILPFAVSGFILFESWKYIHSIKD